MFNIVRRAYGKREVVEQVQGFVAAELRAMALKAEKQDGEYFAVPVEYGTSYPAGGVDQSTLPIAWL